MSETITALTQAQNFMETIVRGDVDSYLERIEQTIKNRRSLTGQVFIPKVGGRAKLNHHTRPRYLIGEAVTITKINQKTCKVDLDHVVGKTNSNRGWFKDIKVPLSMLEKLD